VKLSPVYNWIPTRHPSHPPLPCVCSTRHWRRARISVGRIATLLGIEATSCTSPASGSGVRKRKLSLAGRTRSAHLRRAARARRAVAPQRHARVAERRAALRVHGTSAHAAAMVVKPVRRARHRTAREFERCASVVVSFAVDQGRTGRHVWVSRIDLCSVTKPRVSALRRRPTTPPVNIDCIDFHRQVRLRGVHTTI
jgi:hypothetical protein